MEKIYYSISEVAHILEETAVTVRFWSNTFDKYLNPHRNSHGNRQYSAKDVEVLKKIRFLTRDSGLSLDAVMRKLSQSKAGKDNSLELRDSLLHIRNQLMEIRDTL